MPNDAQLEQLRPTFQLRFCVICAMPAAWRFDWKNRPYHYCSYCGVRIFIYHINGLMGMELLHQNIMRSNPERVRQALRARVERRTREIQRAVRPRRVARK